MEYTWKISSLQSIQLYYDNWDAKPFDGHRWELYVNGELFKAHQCCTMDDAITAVQDTIRAHKVWDRNKKTLGIPQRIAVAAEQIEREYATENSEELNEKFEILTRIPR